jgi:hypothetical protein
MPRATGVHTLSSIAGVALLATTACSHAPAFKYDDDADVADLKEQFSCGGAPTFAKTVPSQQRLPCVAELWKIAPKPRGPGN